MFTIITPFRRSLLLLTLCAALAPLAGCKKNEDAAAAGAAGAAPAEVTPAEAAPKEEPAVELKAKWPADQRLVVQVNTHTDSEMANPALPQPFKSENFITQEIAFTAGKERETGGSEVDVELVTVRVENKAAGKSTPVFDPKGDPKAERSNPVAGAFRKLLGSRVKYQTDASGKVTKVDGVPQLVSRVTTGLPIQSQFLVRSMLTEDAIRGWNVLHQNLPTNSVKIGDTWESTREVPYGVAKFVVNTTNTFTGWEQRNNKKVAKITTVGLMEAKVGAPATIALGEGSSITGSLWYDAELGVISESDMVAQFSVTINQPTGQSVATKLKTKTTSKLIGGAAAASAPAAEPPATAKPAEKKP